MATLTSSFAIGYQNLASGRTVAATTSASGYSASSLSQSRLSSSHRTTGLSSQNIDVDLGSSQAVDVMALIGTNLTDSANRTPVLSNNSGYSAPLYAPGSASVFNVSYPDLATVTYRYGRNLIVLPGVTYSPRYVRLTLNNGTNPAGYLSTRVYWVGPLWQPQYSFPIKEGSFTKRREYVGEPGVERFITYLDVQFEVLSEAEGRALESICMARLRTGRLLVIPRPQTPATWQSEALYCTLGSAAKLTAWPQGGGEIRWKVQLTFKECED